MAAPSSPASGSSREDWAGLADGPAGLIAERVLAYDVADYVRFRAVCRPWRRCSADPRVHGGLHRRFHPWRWTMLREELASPTGRSFLNTSTGECVQVDIPELRDHELLARTVDPPPCPNWRDWSDLGDGPTELIAERVLAYDVADYVRFRAVCRPWRQSSTEPRSHIGLDRRFHPWRWTMLREKLASPTSRSFLNTSTAECVKVDIPELRDHELLAVTPQGLFVLVHKKQRATICLLNPLTHHLTELPPLTTLLPPKNHNMLLENYIHFNEQFTACSGIANDDSTVVLCFNRLRMVGLAKPGDDSWNLLEYNGDWIPSAPLMFAGRFYCVNLSGVMVLEMGADQTPQLKKVAGNLSRRVSPFADSVHLVNNCGELILVHRRCGRLTARNKSGWGYDVYRVDLDTGTLFPVKSLGGNAVFMGLYCSLSVPLDVFPSGSLRADTIYFRFDIRERNILTAGAYHLADASVELPCSLVPQPHTLIDCLSFSETVKE